MIVLRIFLGLMLISFVSAGTPYVVFNENGKAGVKSQDGRILIPAQYDEIGWSNGKFSIIENVTGFRVGRGWGVINLSNQKVTKNQFTDLYPTDGNLIVAGKLVGNSLRPAIGCITSSGKNVIPFLYDGISISGLRAIVFTQIGNQFRYGLIDLKNQTLIPQQYQDVRSVGTLRYAVRNFDGKTALFSENGQQITDFNIDSVSVFKNNFAIMHQGKNKGLIDRTGAVRLESTYRHILIDSPSEVKAKKTDEWIFLTSDNKRLRTVPADSVTPLGNGLFKILTGNVAQLVDHEFSPVGNAQLTNIGPFRNGKAVYQLGSLFGVILTDGKLLIPALYQDLIIGEEYIIASQRNNSGKNWILFDSVGQRKVKRVYESIKPLMDGFFMVQHRGFFGLINEDGTEIVACAYDSILDYKGDNLAVKFKGLYGVINTAEKWLVTPRANRISLLSGDRFIEHTPTSAVLKERKGSVIYFTSNRIDIFPDHILEHLPSGTKWKVDFNGLIVDRQAMPTEATESIYEEAEGFRAIKRNGKFGFIDSKGRLRIANRYEAVQPFSDGYAAVKILGKWGYINMRDNIAIQPVYDEVFPFERGVARVKQKGMFGMVDKKGKLVLPVRYDKIDILSTGNFLISLNGAQGMTSAGGNVLIQPRYDFIQDNGNGFAIAGKGGQFGVINYNGVSTIPMMYSCLLYDAVSGHYRALKEAAWENIKID